MRRHLAYGKAVIRHKWYVFLACLQFGVPLLSAIFHDWDKFLPDEWFAYANYFYGEKVARPNTWTIDKDGNRVPIMEPPADAQRAFDYAWNLHQKRNKHHWQFWLLRNDDPKPNFGFMSMDGGMTHVTVTRQDGKDAALVWHSDVGWWKPDSSAEQQLERELNYIPQALPMPENAMREMLADWYGAGRAYNPNWTILEPRKWYEARKDKMQLHPDTRLWVETELFHREQAYLQDLRRRSILGI